MTPITQVLAACALSAVIGRRCGRAAAGGTVGSFVAFITAMLMLVSPLKHLSDVAGPITRGMAALERGIDLVDTARRSRRPVCAGALRRAAGAA